MSKKDPTHSFFERQGTKKLVDLFIGKSNAKEFFDKARTEMKQTESMIQQNTGGISSWIIDEADKQPIEDDRGYSDLYNRLSEMIESTSIFAWSGVESIITELK